MIRLVAAALAAGAALGCSVLPEPRQTQMQEAQQASPKALVEKAMEVRAPGPPPFTEKLVPVARGLEEKRFFTLSFDSAPLGAVLQSLVRDTDFSLSVEEGVDLGRTVTVHAKNSTLTEILDLVVAKGAGYAWQVENGQLEVNRFLERTYVLDYLDVAGTTEVDVGGDMLASSVEEAGVTGKFQIKSKRDEKRTDVWAQVAEVLGGMKSADGILQLNPQSGLIYMADTPRRVAAMVRFLDSLRESLHRQVLIEAKVIEVRLNDTTRYGIDWGQIGLALNQANFPDRFFDRLDLSFNRGGQIILSDVTQLNAIVDFLETQGDVTVLSNPHLSVLNGQSAVMTVGSQFPFSDIVGVSRDEETNVVTIDLTIKRAVFGLQLGLTPQISKEGVITLNIVPTITRQEGTELVQIPTGVVGQVQSVSNPIIGLQEVATTVRVREGQAVVIAGLISQEKTLNKSGLPGLRRLPLLGHLFGNAEEITSSRELVILIRPRIKEVS